jgi:hypothetical protein
MELNGRCCSVTRHAALLVLVRTLPPWSVVQCVTQAHESSLFPPPSSFQKLRVGQSRISAPYMTVCMVISLLIYL